MPAATAHYLFALRVFSKLKKAGCPVADRDMALIGAQGPDIFFFHRVMPWQRGESYAAVGLRLHHMSPARLFEGFRMVYNTHPSPEALGYVQGMFCHYALDRAVHPYVGWAQRELQTQQPAYARRPNFYHHRVESALDTLTLRRETGRSMAGYDLSAALPPDRGGHDAAVGALYRELLFLLFGQTVSESSAAKAPEDMRRVLKMLNDPSALRERLLLRPAEKLSGRGRFVTPLLRPRDTSDWDYANARHAPWSNPFDPKQVGAYSYYDLFDEAADEAADMVLQFAASLPSRRPMQEITQDRGFYSDLPGVYDSEPKGGQQGYATTDFTDVLRQRP